jgi:hypothetical protein
MIWFEVCMDRCADAAVAGGGVNPYSAGASAASARTGVVAAGDRRGGGAVPAWWRRGTGVVAEWWRRGGGVVAE